MRKKRQTTVVLIRGIDNISGSYKIGKALRLDKSFYSVDIQSSQRIWIENTTPLKKRLIKNDKRIGIDYVGKVWANKPWRFYI